jgi:hypothetical protein
MFGLTIRKNHPSGLKSGMENFKQCPNAFRVETFEITIAS